MLQWVGGAEHPTAVDPSLSLANGSLIAQQPGHLPHNDIDPLTAAAVAGAAQGRLRHTVPPLGIGAGGVGDKAYVRRAKRDIASPKARN